MVIPDVSTQTALAAVKDDGWFALEVKTTPQKLWTDGDGGEMWRASGPSVGHRIYIGESLTTEDVERLPGDHSILLSNMRGNDWERVVRTRRGNFQPVEPGDVVIAAEQVPARRLRQCAGDLGRGAGDGHRQRGGTRVSEEHALRQAEQQMLAARPWDAAEPQSLWSITGQYPGGRGTFTGCLAITLPEFVTGSDKPLFAFLPPLDGCADPAWITAAEPLLIVHRDEPDRAYWADDQDLLPGRAA